MPPIVAVLVAAYLVAVFTVARWLSAKFMANEPQLSPEDQKYICGIVFLFSLFGWIPLLTGLLIVKCIGTVGAIVHASIK